MINLLYIHNVLKDAKFDLLGNKEINIHLIKIEKQLRNCKGSYLEFEPKKFYNDIIKLMNEENFYRKLVMINELNGRINYVC